MHKLFDVTDSLRTIWSSFMAMPQVKKDTAAFFISFEDMYAMLAVATSDVVGSDIAAAVMEHGMGCLTRIFGVPVAWGAPRTCILDRGDLNPQMSKALIDSLCAALSTGARL